MRMRELVEREREAEEGDERRKKGVSEGDEGDEGAQRSARGSFRVEKAREQPGSAGGPARATTPPAAAAEGEAAAQADSRPGEADGVLYEHRHDRIVGTTTSAERERSRRAVLVARQHEDRGAEEQRTSANEFNAEPSARRAGKRARETLSTKRFVGGDERSAADSRARAAAAASSRAAADTPEARDARDADDVVAALAAHEGVSLAEMGRKLLAGSTADRAALLRAFLVAKRADTGVMLFH